jgi:bla regulator protein BlaR1
VIPFVLNHVWQSTAFAAVVGLVALALRRHSARARFWLWMFASVKFLVPFAMLAVLGTYLPRRATPVAAQPAPVKLSRLAAPFIPAERVATQLSPLMKEEPAASSSEKWAPLLWGLWVAGFAGTVGRRAIESWRIRRSRRAARVADGPLRHLPVPVLLTDGSVQPGVFGVLRPVLLLPADIADRLSPEELRAVVAHELAHVRRRDNLWAALHGMVQAIFWFHPLVWWMGSRLVAEREHSCDEAVLAEGVDAEDYAATILAVCRYYACAPRAGVAGIAGADLKERVAAIMRFGAVRYSVHVRAGLAALAVAAVVTPVILGRVYGQTPKLSFDAASVHEWGPGQGPEGRYAVGVQFSPGRISSKCASLNSLIFYAYGLNGSEGLEGLPKWANASCGYPDSAGTFRIEATMPAGTTTGQSREMMQTLLAERFHFGAHWESRELPVFALEAIPGKLKVKQSDPGQDPPSPHSIGCPGDDPRCHIWCCGSATMTGVAGTLTRTLERPVLDKTGLEGTFYFGLLKWAGDDSAGSSLPSLPALLRDEFGLELKAERGPVPVLVVDRVEKPGTN